MNAFTHRTWVPFYLASFGTLSVVVFRSLSGFMLLFSLLVVVAALAIIFLTIQMEVEKNTERKELMTTLSRRALATRENGSGKTP